MLVSDVFPKPRLCHVAPGGIEDGRTRACEERDHKELHAFPSNITRDDPPITRDSPPSPSNITREVTHQAFFYVLDHHELIVFSCTCTRTLFIRTKFSFVRCKHTWCMLREQLPQRGCDLGSRQCSSHDPFSCVTRRFHFVLR